MNRKILTLCMALLLLLSCAIAVSAEEFDPEKTGAISATLTDPYETAPIAGAELSIYYIATVNINTDGKLSYTYTKEFADTGISLNDPDLAAKLDAYLSQNEVAATKLRTDGEGNAVCGKLPLGLYFIRQTNAVDGFAPCRPFLVTIPMENDDGYLYAVDASPKTEVAKLISITVKKVWNTDGSVKATDSVTVELLCDGKVVQSATLSEKNNWQTTYPNMPQSDAYSIQEVNIPQGFTATYQQNGYEFTVTNTASLAQTGQLIWPIPVLAIVGVSLITAGSVLLQKKRDKNA